jgi:hypothetical protein
VRASLLALLLPGCILASEVTVAVGGTIDNKGHVAVEIMPRAAVGLSSGDGDGAPFLLGFTGDLSFGRERLYGVGLYLGGFVQDVSDHRGASYGVAFGPAWLDGRMGLQMQVMGSLYRELRARRDQHGDCVVSSDGPWGAGILGACATEGYLNAGSELSLSTYWEVDSKPPAWRLRLGAGAMVGINTADVQAHAAQGW